MTKCTFHKFGTSGDIEKHDAMCILPLNIGTKKVGWPTKCKYFTILVNEKIYIFLWFWFLLLGFLTSLVFFYRILIVVSPKIRVGENLELIKTYLLCFVYCNLTRMQDVENSLQFGLNLIPICCRLTCCISGSG